MGNACCNNENETQIDRFKLAKQENGDLRRNINNFDQ